MNHTVAQVIQLYRLIEDITCNSLWRDFPARARFMVPQKQFLRCCADIKNQTRLQLFQRATQEGSHRGKGDDKFFKKKKGITAHIFSNFFRESLIVSLWIIHMKSVVEELLQERYRKRTRISYNHLNSVEPANHSMESVQMPDHMSLKKKLILLSSTITLQICICNCYTLFYLKLFLSQIVV